MQKSVHLSFLDRLIARIENLSSFPFRPSPFRSNLKSFFLFPFLTLDLENSFGQTADIVAGDTGNGDTAVLGGVDGVLLGQLVHLLGVQASVGEHANLAGDVGPVVLGAELLEVLLEEGTHGDDSVGHALDLTQPLLVQLGVAEDLGGNAGAVDGGVGVQRADEDLQLRVDTLLLLGVSSGDGEGTDTLSVETLF